MTDDIRAQYEAAVAATGIGRPSQAAVMFQLSRHDDETQLEFMDRVNAILAHHPDRRAALPEVRFDIEPPPGWRALAWARIDAEEARRRNRWYRRLWRWMRGVQ